MSNQGEIDRTAKDAADVEIRTAAEIADDAGRFIELLCDEADPNVDGTELDMEDRVFAADAMMDENGADTIKRPKHTYLGNVIDELATQYLGYLAAGICAQTAQLFEDYIDDELIGCGLDISDPSDLRCSTTNPLGHMRHIYEDDGPTCGDSAVTVMHYAVEGGRQHVIYFHDYDVYLIHDGAWNVKWTVAKVEEE